jgi:FkbM family methyltransferase
MASPVAEEQYAYYLAQKDEFRGEDGHKLLMKKLTPFMPIFGKKALAIDVGANKGGEWEGMREILKEQGARILAFEPNRVNTDLLKEKAKEFPEVDVFSVALSDKEGHAPLFCWKDRPRNVPGYSLAGLRAGGVEIGQVFVRTLDAILRDYPPEEWTVKYVKIDTEGNDTLVIKGLAQNLGRVHYILFEASDCLDDIRGPGEATPLKNCVDQLDAAGFDVYRIGTRRLLRINGDMWVDGYEAVKFWSNCFAVRRTDKIMNFVIDSRGFFKT